jgi:hypothetical protein
MEQRLSGGLASCGLGYVQNYRTNSPHGVECARRSTG